MYSERASQVSVAGGWRAGCKAVSADLVCFLCFPGPDRRWPLHPHPHLSALPQSPQSLRATCTPKPPTPRPSASPGTPPAPSSSTASTRATRCVRSLPAPVEACKDTGRRRAEQAREGTGGRPAVSEITGSGQAGDMYVIKAEGLGLSPSPRPGPREYGP